VKAFAKAKDVSDAEVIEDLKVTTEQVEAIHVALSECGVDIVKLLAKAELTDLREMRSEDAPKAIKWILSHKKAAAL
jgi:hypothetical protein